LPGADLARLGTRGTQAGQFAAQWPKIVEAAAAIELSRTGSPFIGDLAAAFHSLQWNRGNDGDPARLLIERTMSQR
jgi:hypothetical protein